MHTTRLACQCGQFHLELEGEPFIAAECHCNSCREAASRMHTVRPMTIGNGGTPFVLYRKDRVRFPEGTNMLEGHRLSEKAPTRRVVTTCCSTPVFLEFTGAHWLSMYASLWPDNARPTIDIRTMTSDLAQPTTLDDSLPAGRWTTAGFYARLLAAWIAMGFKAPKLEIAEHRAEPIDAPKV